MAIAKKPKANIQLDNININNKNIDDIINRGGSVPSEQNVIKTVNTESNLKLISLRIPSDLVKEIDDDVKCQTLKRSRNTWITEAILEKLNKL